MMHGMVRRWLATAAKLSLSREKMIRIGSSVTTLVCVNHPVAWQPLIQFVYPLAIVIQELSASLATYQAWVAGNS